MPAPSTRAPWFDAHLDLAALAVNGRDLLAPPETCGGPWQPASITLPSMKEARVVAALATIFTERDGADHEGYPRGDAEAAHRRGRAQLEVYLTLRDAGHVAIDLPRALRADPGVGEIRGGMGVAEVVQEPAWKRLERSRSAAPLHLGLLMENADPIREPDELPWWVERGVIAIGLTWGRSSRYASGNAEPDGALTDIGRAMIPAMDALGVTHDLSHLSQRATDELLALTDRPVIASHSNCRALLGGENERHIADETIAEVARRGGVIGVNLVTNFLDHTLRPEDGVAATIDDVVRHMERICDIAGSAKHIALGSDADGGFSARWLPQGIDHPRDYEKITRALAARGWAAKELDGFRFENWARFFGRSTLAGGADTSAPRTAFG